MLFYSFIKRSRISVLLVCAYFEVVFIVYVLKNYVGFVLLSFFIGNTEQSRSHLKVTSFYIFIITAKSLSLLWQINFLSV